MVNSISTENPSYTQRAYSGLHGFPFMPGQFADRLLSGVEANPAWASALVSQRTNFVRL